MKRFHYLILFGLMSLFVFLLLGLPLGTSFYTFYYANGFSYLSNNPQACTNCHIMQDQYNSWSKSGHHHVAVCNDCHAPADIVGKYLTKMTNGYHHSLAFTTGNFSDPIRIKPHNKQIALNSCLRCHENILSKTNHQNKDCLHCHRDVAHPQ